MSFQLLQPQGLIPAVSGAGVPLMGVPPSPLLGQQIMAGRGILAAAPPRGAIMSQPGVATSLSALQAPLMARGVGVMALGRGAIAAAPPRAALRPGAAPSYLSAAPPTVLSPAAEAALDPEDKKSEGSEISQSVTLAQAHAVAQAQAAQAQALASVGGQPGMGLSVAGQHGMGLIPHPLLGTPIPGALGGQVLAAHPQVLSQHHLLGHQSHMAAALQPGGQAALAQGQAAALAAVGQGQTLAAMGQAHMLGHLAATDPNLAAAAQLQQMGGLYEAQKQRQVASPIIEERDPDAPEVDPDRVTLDFYNSDLNLVIAKDGYSAEVLNNPAGFCFCWAGVRASYGVSQGKICYEVYLSGEQDVDFGEEHTEQDPHVLRVGWSTDASSFQLGEEPDSYGFGGTGRFSVDNKFTLYGERFAKGDVIMALLDLDARPPTISYMKNGVWLGVAKQLRGHIVGKPTSALFPHILSKNCQFEVNFGQRDSWFPAPPGFTYIDHVPQMARTRGLTAPPRKADCEMIMIVGLPGAGKTTWAQKTVQTQPDKRYNVIGTDTLIEKMRVNGLPRKKNYHGRWDVLIQKATNCLNKLFNIGARRRRNYILDQTNVYLSARRRKMKNFQGFRRICAVIQPEDNELKRREWKRTHEDGKYVPESAVLEMKANYSLPQDTDQYVDEIRWIEMTRSDASKLIEGYNVEGKTNKGNRDDLFPYDKFKRDQMPGSSQRPGHYSASPQGAPQQRGRYDGPPDKRLKTSTSTSGSALDFIKQEYDESQTDGATAKAGYHADLNAAANPQQVAAAAAYAHQAAALGYAGAPGVPGAGGFLLPGQGGYYQHMMAVQAGIPPGIPAVSTTSAAAAAALFGALPKENDPYGSVYGGQEVKQEPWVATTTSSGSWEADQSGESRQAEKRRYDDDDRYGNKPGDSKYEDAYERSYDNGSRYKDYYNRPGSGSSGYDRKTDSPYNNDRRDRRSRGDNNEESGRGSRYDYGRSTTSPDSGYNGRGSSAGSSARYSNRGDQDDTDWNRDRGESRGQSSARYGGGSNVYDTKRESTSYDRERTSYNNNNPSSSSTTDYGYSSGSSSAYKDSRDSYKEGRESTYKDTHESSSPGYKESSPAYKPPASSSSVPAPHFGGLSDPKASAARKDERPRRSRWGDASDSSQDSSGMEPNPGAGLLGRYPGQVSPPGVSPTIIKEESGPPPPPPASSTTPGAGSLLGEYQGDEYPPGTGPSLLGDKPGLLGSRPENGANTAAAANTADSPPTTDDLSQPQDDSPIIPPIRHPFPPPRGRGFPPRPGFPPRGVRPPPPPPHGPPMGPIRGPPRGPRPPFPPRGPPRGPHLMRGHPGIPRRGAPPLGMGGPPRGFPGPRRPFPR